MIGFNAEYQRADEMWMMLSLTKALERIGHDVQILPAGRTHRIHPYLDSRLARARSYEEWASRCSWVVFSELPPLEYVYAAKKSGAGTALMVQWSFLDGEDFATLNEFDTILCPSSSVYKHFRDQPNLPRAVYLPADLGMPVIANENSIDPNRVAMLWYLDGSQPLVQEMSFMEVARSLMKDPRVYMTVLYSNRLAQNALNELLRLQLEADGRLELMRDVPWEKQFLVVAAHDLVLWPSLIENTGVAGLLAATSGTPCLAYDYPVIADAVRDEINGILLPCDLAFNDFRVPAVVKRDDFFLDNARRLLDATDMLQHMRSTAACGLETRRDEFNAALEKTFAYRPN